MVLTQAQQRRLSVAGVPPDLELLVGVATKNTPPKTPPPTLMKDVPALEVAATPQPFEYQSNAGLDLGGCDDDLTIEVVEVGDTNYCIEVPYWDQGNPKPKDPGDWMSMVMTTLRKGTVHMILMSFWEARLTTRIIPVDYRRPITHHPFTKTGGFSNWWWSLGLHQQLGQWWGYAYLHRR